MPYLLRRSRVLLWAYYALMIEYRGEIALWAIATTLPLIMMGIWVEAGASGAFSMDAVGMARYFLAVFVIRQFTVAWVIHDFEWHVVSGRLSPMLLQPMDPWWRYMAAHLGEQGSRLPIAAVMLAGALFLYPAALWGTPEDPGIWWPGWSDLLLGLVAIHLAFQLRFWMQYTLAIGAFWFERITQLHDLIFLPYLFLSGMLFPLQELQGVLGERAVEWVMLTPFPYMVWFPAALLMGEDVPVVFGFSVLIGWTVLFYVVNRWFWRIGLKHYSAMGA